MKSRLTFCISCMLACVAIIGATALLLAVPRPEQGPPHDSTVTASITYFPAGALGSSTNFFSEYLSRLKEPSLLAGIEESASFSYRLDFWSGQHARFIVVRLLQKKDGSIQITTIEQSASPVVDRRAQYSASDIECQKFLNLVETTRFWSMPTVEQWGSKNGPRPYQFDSSTWVFEGVRNGKYHVVIRDGPKPSPFTEMVRFLAKDLGKLDESVIPRALPAGLIR
jgi:hypothetical protein